MDLLALNYICSEAFQWGSCVITIIHFCKKFEYIDSTSKWDPMSVSSCNYCIALSAFKQIFTGSSWVINSGLALFLKGLIPLAGNNCSRASPALSVWLKFQLDEAVSFWWRCLFESFLFWLSAESHISEKKPLRSKGIKNFPKKN